MVSIVAFAALLALAGCSMLESLMPGGAQPTTRGASMTDDGREVGGYKDGRLGDTLTNAFFSYTVDDAWLSDDFEGESPSQGNTFLVAEITVKNEFGEELTMWAEDFQIQWGDTDEEYGYPIEKLAESQMEDEYTLKRAETITALCVYEVPAVTEEQEYSISYLEYYEDGLEGNVYFCYFDLKPPEAV
jgi:hypothetical protein